MLPLDHKWASQVCSGGRGFQVKDWSQPLSSTLGQTFLEAHVQESLSFETGISMSCPICPTFFPGWGHGVG